MTADRLLSSPIAKTLAALAIIVIGWPVTSEAAPETFNTALEKDYVIRAGFRLNFQPTVK